MRGGWAEVADANDVWRANAARRSWTSSLPPRMLGGGGWTRSRLLRKMPRREISECEMEGKRSRKSPLDWAFLLSSPRNLSGALYLLSGQAWAEGKAELATRPAPPAD